MSLQIQSLLGLIAFPLIAFMFCTDRSKLQFLRTVRLVVLGVAIQVLLAAALLKFEALRDAFDIPAAGIERLQSATLQGMKLVFGHLAGGAAPYEAVHPENQFVLALQALPLILVVSVLSKLFYHWGVLPLVVRLAAKFLERSMSTSGPVATSAAANIFLGMVEAPLTVRPYLASMSRAELFATMSVGMAGVAGTVLVIYASLLAPHVPGAAGHLIVASVMSVPAALLLSELVVPESGKGHSDVAEVSIERTTSTSMDAVTQGTQEGLLLLVNVAAMLVVSVALVSLTNMLFESVSSIFGQHIRLQDFLGWIFAPLAWLLGLPWGEAIVAGGLLGTKTVLNEFVAFLDLSTMPEGVLSARSYLIMSYALCGFANLASLGIMIGGLTAMVPTRRADILDLGPKTLLVGTLSTLMTAAAIGIFAAP